ncbi:hypothetical protein ACQ4PT_046328 [Festuca glaucescens]
MASRRSGWINWDDLGDEAEEDAGELNYEYEWIVPEPEEEEVQILDQRRGGRLGLAEANENGGLDDSEEHVEVELEGDNNEDEEGSGGASGNENGEHGNTEEHVEVEPEGDTNEEGEGTEGASGANGTVGRKRRWYQLQEKQTAYAMILERTAPGVMSRGVSQEVSVLTGIPVGTLQKWWKKCKEVGGMHGLENKKSKNCGRKRIAFDPEVIKQVELRNRTTLKDLANELNMAKTTLWRRLQEGLFRRHTNAIKSTLTDDNKVARVRFCLSMFDELTLPEDPTFKEMYNVIHIDEKWFYRTRGSQNYYLAPDEEDPYKSTQSKNFIEKVMFLAAVARPRYDADGAITFDGKLGIWPFTYEEEAKRKSKNRDAGTMVTKVLPAVTKDVSRQYMINFLLPAIRARWPAAERGTPIFIQQDNAKTHIPVDDPEFIAAAQADGWDICLTCQPPNSPDLNILDLGFFAALQSLFHKLSPGSIDDIVLKVQQAFVEYPPERSNRIFLSLQACMCEVLKQLGGNRYKVPHLRKAVLERLGTLPVALQCAASIVCDAIESLPDA